MTFTLQNDPPCRPAPRFESTPARQRVLLAGLDCLPGQSDLFDTDGPPAENSGVTEAPNGDQV